MNNTLTKKFKIGFIEITILIIFFTLTLTKVSFNKVLVHHSKTMSEEIIVLHREEILNLKKINKNTKVYTFPTNKEINPLISSIKFYNVQKGQINTSEIKIEDFDKSYSKKSKQYVKENEKSHILVYSIIEEKISPINESILGILEVDFDMTDITSEFNIFLVNLLVLEVLIFTVIYAIFIKFFNSYIKTPLNLLKNSLEEIIKDDYEKPIEYLKEDEIGDFIAIYNKMIWTIKSRTKKLKNEVNRRLELKEENLNYQNNLENMVKERTEELYSLNEKLKKKNHELASLQSQMIHQEKLTAIGQLSAGIAHEINNPLGFINSNFMVLKKYVEILEETIKNAENNDDKTQLEFIFQDLPILLDETSEGIERIKLIVQNLKDFSRADDNQQMVEYNINAGLESTLIVTKNEYKYNCDIVKNYGEIPIIYARGGEINQVFLNIIINATHAIKEKNIHGIIEITTYEKEDFCYCEIKDNGCGISEEIKNEIFNPFFTTKEPGKGTGLGLNISYNIIAAHNGTLDVESKLGQYTKFIIGLPIKSKTT